jgi:transcriptional regulator with XRE-family HTH domain
MKTVTAEQIRGARSMQKWTREEMAEASGLSRNTICNLESGDLIPRGKTLEKLCQAIKEVGLEFTDGGVRRIRMDVALIEGEDSVDIFLDLLLNKAKSKGGEIIGIFPTQKVMMKSLGIENGNFERLKKILVHADMKVLLREADAPQFLLDNFQYKIAHESCNCAMSYFVFDNSFAMVFHGNREQYKYAVFNSTETAIGNKIYFSGAWIAASFRQASRPIQQKNEERARA